jgi:CHAT domain-containing protein
LSGIVLAGANGLLTAEEVIDLDLRGCELVVLSACETALGKIVEDEGVFGLQRAFGVAGARGVIAGLWSVDDRATHAMMVRFYDNLWRNKMPAAAALRDAQSWIKSEGLKPDGPLRGLTVQRDPESVQENGEVSPFYWAAFTLSGDWK